jgi:hypothetical protein
MFIKHKMVDRIIIYYKNEPEDQFKFVKKMYELLDEGYEIVYGNLSTEKIKICTGNQKITFERIK